MERFFFNACSLLFIGVILKFLIFFRKVKYTESVIIKVNFILAVYLLVGLVLLQLINEQHEVQELLSTTHAISTQHQSAISVTNI